MPDNPPPPRGFDDDEFTPAPPPPDMTPEQAARLRATFDAALAEHEELVKLRLERAALVAKADELDTAVLRLKRQVAAIAARAARAYEVARSMKAERDAAKREVAEIRKRLR